MSMIAAVVAAVSAASCASMTASRDIAWQSSLFGDGLVYRRGLQDTEPDQTNAPEGCKIVEVGCFADGDNCEGGVSDCRSLRYGVDCCSGQGTSPAPTPSPKCDQPTLTNEACALYCYEWLKDESPDVVYGGTNNGECYCDTDYEPGKQNGLCGGACPESSTGCTLPCNGNAAEMCGSAWFNMVYKVDCGGGGEWPWAFPLIIGFVAVNTLYLVGGMYINSSAGKTGKDLIPNRAVWEQLFGLVGDGLVFTMGHGKPDTVAGYTPVGDAGVPPPQPQLQPQLPPQLPPQLQPPGYSGATLDPLVAHAGTGKRRRKKKRGHVGGTAEGGRRRKKNAAVGLPLAIKDSSAKKKKKLAEAPASGME